MIIQEDLNEFFRLLNEKNVEYVLVGGYAVAFHGFVRATKDIDVLFRNTPANIARLMSALAAFGIAATAMDANTFSEQGRIIRIGTPPAMIELINAIGGVSFDEIWSHKVHGNYGDAGIYFISKTDLLTSKKSAGRPQDLRDIEELEK